jgi:hypothetical protein
MPKDLSLNVNGISVFSKNDFNSDNGMSTTIWGPIIWSGLHITSFNYPVNPTASDKKNYKNWFLSYKYILPCVYCRSNFEKNLQSANFNNKVFDSRLTFSKFIYKFHNCVNIMLGKKIYFDYNYVKNLYENFRSSCNEKDNIKNNIEGSKKIIIKDKTKLEKKCDGSLYSIKSKTIIKIVPHTNKEDGLKIHNKCKKKSKKKN